METTNSYLRTPWRAAHRRRIADSELQDVHVPRVCEELRAHLPGGGGGPSGSPSCLSLGAVALLVNGTAILLQQKAKQTLTETFELCQKIILKNYQTDSQKWDAEYDFETEDIESEEDADSGREVTSGTSGPASCKRSAAAMDDLDTSRRLRSRETTKSESDSSHGRCSPQNPAPSGSSLAAAVGVTDDDSPADGNENISNDVRDKAGHTCRCLSAEQARGARTDHRLGVMLVFETCERAVPTKLVISSIHPAAKL